MGEGLDDRKQWIEDRLQFLAENFAIAVGGLPKAFFKMRVLCCPFVVPPS